ncbi:MAG: hypothetical protein M3349_05110 [Actinomycetota bacterium]|nr:hypothetical protein [Actinomycetota bacterium]
MADRLLGASGFDRGQVDDEMLARETMAKASPIAHGHDVERHMARHTAARALWVGPVLALITGLIRGWDGAVAALLGVAIVAANFMLSGALMSRAARISLALYHAAALFGFFLRLGLIMATMFTLAWAFEIDRTALGISVVVSYLTLLTWEAIVVSRGGEKELEWT